MGTEGTFEGNFGGNEIWLNKKVWGNFGDLWEPWDEQGGGSLIIERKKDPETKVQVQVQVDDPRSRVQDETWSRPALKRGGGYIYIYIFI